MEKKPEKKDEPTLVDKTHYAQTVAINEYDPKAGRLMRDKIGTEE